MSEVLPYRRKFVILKDDKTNISGIRPKGHGRVEIKRNKGYITLNVENGEVNNEYEAFLIGEENGDIVEAYLGKIFTNRRGKGHINLNFNIKNVKNTNLSIEKFDGIVIRRDMNILLIGYINENSEIIEKYIEKLNKVEKPKEESIETNIPKEPEIEEMEEKKETVVEKEGKVQEEEVVEKMEKGVEEVEEDIEKEIEEDIEQIESEIEETEGKAQKEKIIDLSCYESVDYARKLNYKNKLNSYVLNILRFFPYIDPFKFGLKGYDWWRIEYDSSHGYRGFLPFYNYLMNTSYEYPFMGDITTCFHLMKKYNHYLFGTYKEKGEVKYYLYGVPGKFTSTEHPFMGTTGFNTWFDGKKGFGYWIIYIDPLTGKVVFPLNPMTPLG